MSFVINRALYPKPAIDETGTIIPSQQTTVTGTAAAATAFSRLPNPSVGGFDQVTFDIRGGGVNVRWDTSPTSTVGHYLPNQTAYTWDAQQFVTAKFILDSASSSATIFASPTQS